MSHAPTPAESVSPKDGSRAACGLTVGLQSRKQSEVPTGWSRDEAPDRNCGLRSSESHPPNLSISISGGRETNWDSLSNGERSGKLPRSEISGRAQRETGELWSGEAGCPDAPLPSGPKSTWNGVPERVRAP